MWLTVIVWQNFIAHWVVLKKKIPCSHVDIKPTDKGSGFAGFMFSN